MLRFLTRNWVQILIVIGFFLVSVFFVITKREWMDTLSLILVIPSFVMSFIVLERFNVNDAIMVQLTNEHIRKVSEDMFAKTYNSDLGEVRAGLLSIEKYFTNFHDLSNPDKQMNSQTLSNAQKGLERCRNFYTSTFKYVSNTIKVYEVKGGGVSQVTYSHSMTFKDIRRLGKLLNLMNGDYFVLLESDANNDWRSGLTVDQKNNFRKVFVDVDSYFKNYIRLVEELHSIIKESGDRNDEDI